MNNPYEVLELNENATIDEIKKAYREKVKQYHPDQYINNPLKDLAEEKMREVNEAYEYLMKNHDSYNNYNTTSYGSIRQDINLGNTSSAEYKLNNIKVKDAEWYYLMGLVNLRKGWFNDGYNYIQRACQMEPNNFEYRDTLTKIDRKNSSYRETYNGRYSEDNDMCRLCMGLFCADKCCECCGGDLISCC